jgi:hypothetical protein
MLSFRYLPLALFLVTSLAMPSGAAAAAAGDGGRDPRPLGALAVRHPRLAGTQELVPLAAAQDALPPEALGAWAELRRSSGVEWRAYVDRRNGLTAFAQGGGIALLPGHGNRLTWNDLAPNAGARSDLDLDAVEGIVRAFLPRVAPLLGVAGDSLVLDRGRSGHPAEHLWFVDFDVISGGLPIDGARVVFRINNGNLIQFGSEQLPAPEAAPAAAAIGRDEARAVVAQHLGGLGAADTFLDSGSLHLVPVLDRGPAERGASDARRGLARVWQLVFRRQGIAGTWRTLVDAASGELLELGDLDQHATASVTGGVYVGSDPAGPEVLRPMPFVNVRPGTYANSAGLFPSAGGTVGAGLSGRFVTISDCGYSWLLSNGDGNIAFGTSPGDDCATPGFGGFGNTRAARSQAYWMNRIEEVARGWLPAGNVGGLLVLVNQHPSCSASAAASFVSLGLSGQGCANAGEIPGIALHEFGHALALSYQINGFQQLPDFTGETTGDWTAALALHDSCIGPGYLPANCSGFGDGCTSCTGVRDIDFAKHAASTPATVANFTQPLCPAATAPPRPGPCGRDRYCESAVSSQALWDLVNRDLPSPGTATAWTLVDRLWFLSLPTATAPFSCSTAGAAFTSDGCGVGSLWEVFRAIDDDDGNLANGTPHAAALFAAFNRHGIACPGDAGAGTTFAGCAPPAAPILTAMPGDDQAELSWTASGPAVYDLFRNEVGCDANFARIASGVAGTSLTDGEVANGMTYYYRVAARAAGNEACASALSECRTVTPASGAACPPPATPAGLQVLGNDASGIRLAWQPVPGAASYHVLRGIASGGPYVEIGAAQGTSLTDRSGPCGTSATYVVRAFAGCESGSSAEVAAARPCPSCTQQTLYSNDFEASSSGWSTFPAIGLTSDWRRIQACAAHSGSQIFRFGGSTCDGAYDPNHLDYALAPFISFPAGATSARLSFWHRRDFPSNAGGGTLALQDFFAGTYFLPASTIVSGDTYDGAIQSSCAPAGTSGLPVFTGTQNSFVNTVVDLDAACTLARLAGKDICGGNGFNVVFAGITDCGPTGRGWFLDDVQVTACVPPPPPSPTSIGFFTVTPCRLLDTRNSGQGPALQPGEKRRFSIVSCGISLSASALAANVTVVGPSAPGFLNLYSTQFTSPPATSLINFSPGAVRANSAILGVNDSDFFSSFWIENHSSGQVHVLIDVNGYFQYVF